MSTVKPVEIKGSTWRTPLVILVVGCLIAIIGFGARSVFGLFLEPMTVAKGWNRETFALAMAIQNLLWGIALPFAGAIADRIGPVRVIAGGAVVYAADAKVGLAGVDRRVLDEHGTVSANTTEALAEVPRDQIDMGVADIDETACYPWVDRGVCGACVTICPLGEDAMGFEFANMYRPVVKQACVGCGLCVEVCPHPSRPIKIVARFDEARQRRRG